MSNGGVCRTTPATPGLLKKNTHHVTKTMNTILSHKTNIDVKFRKVQMKVVPVAPAISSYETLFHVWYFC